MIKVSKMSLSASITKEPIGEFDVPLYIETGNGDKYWVGEDQNGRLDVNGSRAVLIRLLAANHFTVDIEIK